MPCGSNRWLALEAIVLVIVIALNELRHALL